MADRDARREEYVRFLETENKTVREETIKECENDKALLKSELDSIREFAKRETACADNAEKRAALLEDEKSKTEAALVQANGTIAELRKELDSSDFKQIAEQAKKANVDTKAIIEALNKKMFGQGSDATRFLNGVIDLDDPYLEDMGIAAVLKHVMAITSDKAENTEGADSEKEEDKPDLPKSKKAKETTPKPHHHSKRKRVYTEEDLIEMGIDTGNLPKGAKIIRRKDSAAGEDVWYLRLVYYQKAKSVVREYKIGRFNIPGGEPMDSRHPFTIIGNNPIMPSFARFYFDSKFNLCLSENRILEIIKSLKTKMSQSSLNRWMHQIMTVLRERLEPLMLEAIRQSKFTNNDGTRILVRGRDADGRPFKYKIEYIQAALSLEKKLCVMLYDEGTRDHTLQEEKIFKGSAIQCFVADGAPQYKKIVKDLECQHITRQACWFHARHYLVNAYLTDKRVKDIIILVNYLFYVERKFLEQEDQSPEARLRYRLRYSRGIVSRIMNKLQAIREAGDEYGQMVHRAVDYILDDREAFQKFLLDGRIDMHNIAIERCFRHIALGRRNWQQSGSHDAAKNIAFIFGLLESCKLNKINFGEYVEDVLTRIMYGEQVDTSFLPCGYVRKYEDGQDNKDAKAKDPKKEKDAA